MKRVHLLPFIFFIPILVSAESSQIDSMKAVMQKLPEDSTKVDALIILASKYYSSAPSEAIQLGKQARDLAEKINYKKGLAYALKSIGMGYYYQSDYVETHFYWQQSLNTFQSVGDKLGVANMMSNLGAINYNQGNDVKAIEFYIASLKASEEIRDTLRIATALVNIGAVYSQKEATLDKAKEYYLQALILSEYLGDHDAIATSAVNLGEIYLETDNTDSALYYFEKSLEAYRKTESVKEAYALTNIGKVYAMKGEFDRAIRDQKQAYEIASNQNARLEMTQSLIGLAQSYEFKGDILSAIESYHHAEKIASEIKASEEKNDAYVGLSLNYAKLSDYKNGYRYMNLVNEMKDTIYNAEMSKRIESLILNFDLEKKQGEVDLLTKDKALQELTIQKQRLAKNAFLAGFILILIIAFVIYRNYRNKVKTNKILDRQKAEIEGLLLNILPGEVAKELQTYGSATPRYYENVTILFTDFKGFSAISQGLSPNVLVDELNDFFMAFDDIMEKYNLEKIKTIGDAYMCAGGIPLLNDTHALDAVRAGLAMQDFMYMKNVHRIRRNLTPWELRVGIHTGPVVAGVVGRKKYAYDIWGSSVNTASRMESNGEAGKINISATTYELVKHLYDCEHRGKIHAKNIGDIDMYFVTQKKEAAVLKEY